LLVVLLPRSRPAVKLFWSAIFVIALLGVAAAALVTPPESSQGDPGKFVKSRSDAAGGDVNSAEKGLLESLSFPNKPLDYAVPPSQAIPAPTNPWRIGGFKPDAAQSFDAATKILAALPRTCSERASYVSDIGAAEQGFSKLMTPATANRAILHYHQGIIDLCKSDPGSAAGEFAAADGNLAKIDPKKQSAEDVARFWEYRTVIYYGWGVAVLAGHGKSSEAKQYFASALAAADNIRRFRQPGAFVTLSAAPRVSAAPDLFDFSTAEIFNAEVYALLSQHDPCGALDLKPDLTAQPTYVEHYPVLAANLATASTLCGHAADRPGLAGTLFELVRRDMENAGNTDSAAAAWKANPLALARLTALAVTESDRVYAAADRDWWPPAGEESDLRTKFENRIGKTDASWFAPVSLSDGDTEKLDLWLFIRREKDLLAASQLADFENDGSVVDDLGPFDREFLTEWRREEAGRYARILLDQAETVRSNGGMAEARPLLEFIASPGMPMLYRVQAREIIWFDRSVASALAIQISILVVLAILAFLHFDIRAGYNRTFTTRHSEDRVRPSPQSKPPAAES
jgi:hypothetical protein